MSNNKTSLENFDFNQFQEEAIARLKSGQPPSGQDGVMTPLIKRMLEAALEGEMEAHITDCKDDGQSNRRNGKSKKTLKSRKANISSLFWAWQVSMAWQYN